MLSFFTGTRVVFSHWGSYKTEDGQSERIVMTGGVEKEENVLIPIGRVFVCLCEEGTEVLGRGRGLSKKMGDIRGEEIV